MVYLEGFAGDHRRPDMKYLENVKDRAVKKDAKKIGEKNEKKN